jgi:mRNA-degrading endonuclease RelE of RelBE toxin-antitoxin system
MSGMSYEAYLTETFQKSIKFLKKKYPRIKDDITGTIHNLEEDPTIGDPIHGWNNEIWKVRTASSDIKKGKRGGFRSIYFWKSGDKIIYLLLVYFKGDKSDVSKIEIEDILIKLNKELG